MAVNQSALQAEVRTRASSASTYNSDWLNLMADDGFTSGPFNARLQDWLNAELVTDGDTDAPYSSLIKAQTAYAIRQGFKRWSDVNSLL